MSSESGGVPENQSTQQISQVETQDQVINEPEEVPQEELPTEGKLYDVINIHASYP